jgi:adenine-specific DNA-methyltransferase
MILDYPNKIEYDDLMKQIKLPKYSNEGNNESLNMIFQGDNLKSLKYLLTEMNMGGKIDLVYIDPPFATGGKFTITEGRASTISNSSDGDIAYDDTLKGFEFIEFLRQRLLIIKELLSEEGSIYLHIDYKIGHYVKVMMDEVFGVKNFRNDITRIKCNPKNFKRKGYSNIKDLILFYSKSEGMIWNEPKTPYTESDIVRLFPKKTSDGRRYTTVPIHAPGETKNGKSNQEFKGMKPPKGRHWRCDVDELNRLDSEGLIEWSSNGNPRQMIFADEKEGKRVQDIWEFKDPQYPKYPTEKNSDLLDFIVKTSSNEGSIVMDCFMGSGTTLKSAHNQGRNWIGMDQSDFAIEASISKLTSVDGNLFVEKPDFLLFKETGIKGKSKKNPKVENKETV